MFGLQWDPESLGAGRRQQEDQTDRLPDWQAEEDREMYRGMTGFSKHLASVLTTSYIQACDSNSTDVLFGPNIYLMMSMLIRFNHNSDFRG